MTTIAYRSGVLASDSRAMLGGWKSAYSLPKLFRMKDGSSVVGVVGNYAMAVKFKDWLDAGSEGDAPGMDDTTVIQMHTEGNVTIHEAGGSFPVQADFAAWGSGMPAAQAALIMGADAARAIEIAAMLDDSTGGDVVTMTCED